ncbi:MAG: prephenate dehydrogenase/arogenate dehydrogenase family protein [Nanobdellota archaeon]
MKIGIIGGNGGMGRLMHNFLSEDFEVLISDKGTPLSNADIAHTADVVIVSVPIEQTIQVVEEIAPLLREDQVLMDITSMKTDPMKAMQESKATVIGLHPMFGPLAEVRGQTVVVTPAEETPWTEWVTDYLEEKGLRCKITTPEKHDEMMAIIQVLVHFNTIAMGHTLASLGLDIDETLEFTSPIYRMELGMIGRIFAQDASLYGNIQMQNPKGVEILRRHQDTIKTLFGMIQDKDLESFVAKFNETAAFFKDFKERALAESEELLRK